MLIFLKTRPRSHGLNTSPYITKLLALLIVAAVVALAGSCRRGGKPGTLTIAVEQPPRGFDPRFSTVNPQSARVMQLVYDTLMVKDERFDFVPWLAENFVESEDHQTFTFRLRGGVKFHDGKALTSADVKYTFDSLLSPAARSPIRGALDKIASIETPDDVTVIFRAREPFYTFVGNLPAIGIIPEGAGQELINAPVGTGPYRFVSYSEGRPVRLAANGEYWAGPPSVSEIEIRVISDNSTRQAALMSGEVDLAYNAQFDPETNRALNGRRRLSVIPQDGTNIAHLGVNLTSPVLSNQLVRQAISYAIDREAIIHRLLRDQARRADSILPPEQWAYEPGVTKYEYDPGRARELLDRAGFVDPDGEGPQSRLSLVFMTLTTQLSRNIAAIAQEQLRRAGIEVELQSLESATFFDKIAKAQFDLYYLISVGGNQSTDIFQFVYHSRYQDPGFVEAVASLRNATEPARMQPLLDRIEDILARREYCTNPEVARLAEQARVTSGAAARKQLYLKISSLLTDRGGANRSRYCNPQVDRWIIEAEQAGDREIKKQLYSRIQKTISEELPQIYLWYPDNILVAGPRVNSIHTEPSGSWFFISKLTLNQ